MENLKIVQFVVGPDNGTYQSALLGLGSDGVIYRADNDSKWHVYFPNAFACDESAGSHKSDDWLDTGKACGIQSGECEACS